MNLSFLLIVHDEGNDLWARCGALAAVTAPGDEVLVCDTGSGDESAQLLRRFCDEHGWGEDVPSRVIALPDSREAPEGGWAALRGLAGHARVLVLPSRARPLPEGVRALRALLGRGAPDLVVMNNTWRIAGPASALPCPDATRWPTEEVLDGADARAAALRLMPDPARLIPSATLPAGDYEASVHKAGRIGFVATPVLLFPLPAPDDPAPRIAELAARLSAAPREDAAELLARTMLLLDDMLATLDPGQAEAFLTASRAFAAALSRRLRRQALAHAGPTGAILSDLRRRDAAAARSRLAVQFAAQDRARVAALAAEIGQLRGDLDVVLPGPEYLIDLFHRARRA